VLSEEIVFSRVAEERMEGCIAKGMKQLHMLSDLVIEGNYEDLVRRAEDRDKWRV